MTSRVSARRAFFWVGVVAPLVLLVPTIVTVLLWLPELPENIAVHWSFGPPDGFGPRWTAILLPLIGLAMNVLFFLMVRLGGRGQVTQHLARPLGALGLGTATLFALLSLVTTGIQRGLSDGTDAPAINGWMLVTFAAAAAATVIGWIAQPAPPKASPSGTPAEPLDSPAGERVAWVGETAVTRRVTILLGALVFLPLLFSVFLITQAGAPSWVWATIFTLSLAMVFVVGGALRFTVVVNEQGLLVVSHLGWPRVTIKLENIAAVTVSRVDPFAEFGGWGLRTTLNGRYGVVLHKGEALEVTRKDGKIFDVTVAGASDAAAVLASYVNAAR